MANDCYKILTSHLHVTDRSISYAAQYVHYDALVKLKRCDYGGPLRWRRRTKAEEPNYALS
ncbi:hypothetical protein MPTK1_3g12863 [Marchantia polymorpha subsp. ruderalis]